jgi:predicted anti-sigma-YlaC factor YlaD
VSRPPIDSRLVDAHLERCPDCRAFAANVHELRRTVAVEVAVFPADVEPVGHRRQGRPGR